MAMALAGTFLIGATGYVRFGPADLVLLAGQTPGSVLLLGVGAALGTGLDSDLGAALERTRLFETPMSPFLHVPPLPDRDLWTNRFYLRPARRWLRFGAMGDEFDIDAMIARFRERARAVRNRPLPPLEGEARREFIERAQLDYQDFAMLGDAEGSLDGGILTLSVDLRPRPQEASEGAAPGE